MPELPEVETVKRGLSELIIGKQIRTVTNDTPKSFPNAPADIDEFIIDAKIVNIRRRAKVLIIDLSTNYSLVTHLKMTGQMVYVGNGERFGAGHPNSSLIAALPDKSTRVIFTFSDESVLYFNDQRKFGWIRLIPTSEIENIDFFKRVGPEPLADDFTAKAFMDRLMKRKNTSIKAALLDQMVIAGVGNIYADESLWGARIHPEAKVSAVPKKKLETLFEELQYVLKLSIEKGGSTDKNYVNAEGKRGSYLQFARVFRREGQECPRCGREIIKMRVAGRGTHVCPSCQKLIRRSF